MSTLVSVVHIVACVLLVLVVLIQSGKGAEISASFAGSSQTVFGSSGGANFFTRFTAAMATIFMITSILLTIMSGQSKKSIFETGNPVSAPAQQMPADTNTAPVQNQNNAAAPAQPAAPAQQNAAPAQPAQPAAPAQAPAQPSH